MPLLELICGTSFSDLWLISEKGEGKVSPICANDTIDDAKGIKKPAWEVPVFCGSFNGKSFGADVAEAVEFER